MASELILWIQKILILIVILAMGYLLYMMQSLLVVLLISGFITLLISPLIDMMERR
jgi:predicted PurR-regulated permease PerM